MNDKKIAIFQNFLDTIGGAEVVGLTMARELDADIYTTNINHKKINQMGFSDLRIHSIGWVPKNAPFRQQILLWRFGRLNLKNKYDFFIINGDWAVSGAIHNKPNLWYVNATMREVWDLYPYVRKNLVGPLSRPLFDIFVLINRYLNKKHVSHVDNIASNSTFTQERVKKYLHRESELIHPPIQTKKFHFDRAEDYWLSVNRLIKYKRVDIQLKAFAKMPDKKLLVIGPYEKSKSSQDYVDSLNKIKTDNVTFIEQADNFEELVNYYSKCKGFITTCLKEDFGMTAIEAMASGKPVIAPNEGGYKETVIDGVTGILIDALDEDKLAEAVKKIDNELDINPEKYTNVCIENVKRFDIENFINQIKSMIKNT